MKSIIDTIKSLEEIRVAQSNYFRFQVPQVVEFTIKNCTKLESLKFLKITLGTGLKVSTDICNRVLAGEHFTDVANDLNSKGLL